MTKFGPHLFFNPVWGKNIDPLPLLSTPHLQKISTPYLHFDNSITGFTQCKTHALSILGQKGELSNTKSLYSAEDPIPVLLLGRNFCVTRRKTQVKAPKHYCQTFTTSTAQLIIP